MKHALSTARPLRTASTTNTTNTETLGCAENTGAHLPANSGACLAAPDVVVVDVDAPQDPAVPCAAQHAPPQPAARCSLVLLHIQHSGATALDGVWCQCSGDAQQRGAAASHSADVRELLPVCCTGRGTCNPQGAVLQRGVQRAQRCTPASTAIWRKVCQDSEMGACGVRPGSTRLDPGGMVALRPE